jgi:hypothetical protein
MLDTNEIKTLSYDADSEKAQRPQSKCLTDANIYNGVTGRSILEFLHEISENIIIALNRGISFAEHVLYKPLLYANRRQ